MDWNLILNLSMFAILAAGAFGAGRSQRMRSTISDLTAALDAKDERLKELAEDIRLLGERASRAELRVVECEKAITGWEARYEELNRYAAKGAVERFEEMIRSHDEAVLGRHEKMIAHLARLDTVLSESQSANSELLLKSLEITSKVAQHLQVRVD